MPSECPGSSHGPLLGSKVDLGVGEEAESYTDGRELKRGEWLTNMADHSRTTNTHSKTETHHSRKLRRAGERERESERAGWERRWPCHVQGANITVAAGSH